MTDFTCTNYGGKDICQLFPTVNIAYNATHCIYMYICMYGEKGEANKINIYIYIHLYINKYLSMCVCDST